MNATNVIKSFRGKKLLSQEKVAETTIFKKISKELPAWVSLFLYHKKSMVS